MADLSSITKLREQTGAGILECKSALDDVKGDFEKALEIIKKKGIAKAAKKGIMHKNTARRKISRLSKKLAKLTA